MSLGCEGGQGWQSSSPRRVRNQKGEPWEDGKMDLGEEQRGRRCSRDSAEGNWGEEGAEWMG